MKWRRNEELEVEACGREMTKFLLTARVYACDKSRAKSETTSRIKETRRGRGREHERAREGENSRESEGLKRERSLDTEPFAPHTRVVRRGSYPLQSKD